ncbi:MAG TPA: hypothetical protein VKZ96_18710 [Thermomicrobiales bacterium]|nr:hypothetical protein [Thermomicrobiales bacterium]
MAGLTGAMPRIFFARSQMLGIVGSGSGSGATVGVAVGAGPGGVGVGVTEAGAGVGVLGGVALGALVAVGGRVASLAWLALPNGAQPETKLPRSSRHSEMIEAPRTVVHSSLPCWSAA